MSARQIALRVAPQRNTQYQELASALARPELELSPLRAVLRGIDSTAIGDAEYLVAGLDDDDRTPALLDRTLPQLAATSDAFEIAPGGWQPIAVRKAAAVPRTLTEARRYSGKTNELFTRVLVNLATFDRYPGVPGSTRVLDPLCGGGTTLFAAMERGASVVGADRDKAAVASTAQYLRQYAKESGLRFSERVERAKGRGRDWHDELTVEPGAAILRCSLLQVGLDDLLPVLAKAPGGSRCHAVVADLPYGLAHKGPLVELVDQVLAVARQVLTGDGRLVLAWNASSIGRSELLGAVDVGSLVVAEGGAFEDLAHRVDRVIKRRDVLVLSAS